MMEQYRWYYNATLSVFNRTFGPREKILEKREYTYNVLRDLLRRHEYQETRQKHLVFEDFIPNQEKNEFPTPEWWSRVHNRVPRGAVKKFTSSVNAAISNYRARNISSFTMKYKEKKDWEDLVVFEDAGFPKFIRDISSNYWFRIPRDGGGRRRSRVSFEDIFESTKKRGAEIIYEKLTGKYFLHYPVEVNWYPPNDCRSENQAKYVARGGRVIALDPGIRKFLVGYDPEGSVHVIGAGARDDLQKLLDRHSLEDGSRRKKAITRRIRNMVDDLHWKTISYLLEHYDIILYPDFRPRGMLQGSNLYRKVKRQMCSLRFFRFKERLLEKAKRMGKEVLIVDERLTSKTCGSCGEKVDVGGSEVFSCSHCPLVADRDAQAARNILLKHLRVL